MRATRTNIPLIGTRGCSGAGGSCREKTPVRLPRQNKGMSTGTSTYCVLACLSTCSVFESIYDIWWVIWMNNELFCAGKLHLASSNQFVGNYFFLLFLYMCYCVFFRM